MAHIPERKRESREDYWRVHVGLCKRSGKSIVQYCRDAGVPVSTYHWWKGELKRRGAARAQHPVFAEVRVALPVDPAPALIEVAVGEELRIRVWPGFDAETLAGVVRVLEAISC